MSADVDPAAVPSSGLVSHLHRSLSSESGCQRSGQRRTQAELILSVEIRSMVFDRVHTDRDRASQPRSVVSVASMSLVLVHVLVIALTVDCQTACATSVIN
jgi:hypothetical protein